MNTVPAFLLQFAPRYPSIGMALGRTRTFFLVFLILVGAVAILPYAGFIWPVLDSLKHFTLAPSPAPTCTDVRVTTEQLPHALLGSPTARFRDNIRNDSSYITSWSSAGYSNQFMSYVNMIYLGTITNRIPIIPPFAPSHHIPRSAGIVPFGDIFDLDYMRKELRAPVLEWRDVKELPLRSSKEPYSTREVEDIGCWTTTKDSQNTGTQSETVVQHLGLDVSYTKIPLFTRFPSSKPDEIHVVFPQVAAVIYPEDPLVEPDKLKNLQPSPKGHQRTPDAHLSCFDSLYYATSGAKDWEWQKSWSPAWQNIGRYLPFTQTLKQLGRAYISRAFQFSGSLDNLPPFIAVHIRRGDFIDFIGRCPLVNGMRTNCFTPLSVYAKHVDVIKGKWVTKSNLTISNVIVMSDEQSPAFWDDVQNHGWSFINHTREETVENFGEWFPPIIDTVIQSFAVGLIGTKGSTFSLVGERRVKDWNGGFTSEVDIGTSQ
ncbi:hypothetical protein BDZ97DRAFT_645557 [Flammula alnicola]|nr:hypothetical protein BDZ97DRAFT_645557 [Flammula alnicola]